MLHLVFFVQWDAVAWIQSWDKLHLCLSCSSSSTQLPSRLTAEPAASVSIDWQVLTGVYAYICILSTAENQVHPQPIECCNSVQNLPWFRVMLHVGCPLPILVDATCDGPICCLVVQCAVCWWPWSFCSTHSKCNEVQFCQLLLAIGFQVRNVIHTLVE